MGGAANQQQYCLRWNNHRSNLLSVFEQLLESESFTDVTLAVNGTSIKCHKMVLAACSSYFQTLFVENTCSHPIIVFKDIQYSDIRAILEYMYRGEVNVAQEQVGSLLKAAESLRVKGESFFFCFFGYRVKGHAQYPIVRSWNSFLCVCVCLR